MHIGCSSSSYNLIKKINCDNKINITPYDAPINIITKPQIFCGGSVNVPLPFFQNKQSLYLPMHKTYFINEGMTYTKNNGIPCIVTKNELSNIEISTIQIMI